MHPIQDNITIPEKKVLYLGLPHFKGHEMIAPQVHLNPCSWVQEAKVASNRHNSVTHRSDNASKACISNQRPRYVQASQSQKKTKGLKLSDRRKWNSAMLSNRERIAPQQTHNIPQLQNLGKRANQSLSRKEPRLGGNVNKGRRTQKSRLENIWGLWRVATLSKICSKIFRAQESALKLSKGTDTTPYDKTKVKEVKQIQRPNLRLETSLAVFSETGQRLRHIQEKLQKIWMRFAGTNTQTSW